jgi:hypothetical protein
MTAGSYQAFVIPGASQAVHYLVDGLARAVHADADEIQGVARGGRHGGAVVGVVGGLEHRLDVDRRHQLARQGALVRPAELFQRGAIDEHRLADQRGIGASIAVAVGLAHHVAVRSHQAAGQKGGDIGDLPGGEVAAQDQGGLGVVDHGAHIGHGRKAVLKVCA